MGVGDLSTDRLVHIEGWQIGIRSNPIESQWFSSHVRPSRSRYVSP